MVYRSGFKRRRNYRRGSRYAKKRTLYKRRFARKKSYKRKALSVFNRRLQVNPSFAYARMRYVEGIFISTSADNVANIYVYRANSVYDPNKTGVGHQPTNRDYWAERYRDYCVISSVCTVKYVRNLGNTHNPEGIMKVYTANAADETNYPDKTSELLEYKGAGCKMIGGVLDDTTQKNKSKAYFNSNKWFKKKTLSDEDQWCTFQQNAVKEVYFIIAAGSWLAGTTYNFLVEIDYFVAMRNRIEYNAEQ